MTGRNPPANFGSSDLDTANVAAGERWGRIYQSRFPDPLGYGKSGSRFNDPRRRIERNRFGVLYLGRTLKVCFVEAVLRDDRDAVIGELVLDEAELTARRYAQIEIARPLTLLDLRDDARIRQGVSSDVVGGKAHGLARRWSVAFHDHPAQVDGLLYPSRLNSVENIALYERANPKLTTRTVSALDAAPDLGPALSGPLRPEARLTRSLGGGVQCLSCVVGNGIGRDRRRGADRPGREPVGEAARRAPRDRLRHDGVVSAFTLQGGAVSGISAALRTSDERRSELRGDGAEVQRCTHSLAVHDPARGDDRQARAQDKKSGKRHHAKLINRRVRIEHAPVASRLPTLGDDGVYPGHPGRFGLGKAGRG